MTVNYVVYNATPWSGTKHDILRWGSVSFSSDVVQQAFGAGEVAATIAGDLPAGNYAFGYSYDTAVPGAWEQNPGSPLPVVYDPQLAYMRKLEIRQALRNSEWSQLPDAPLSTARIAVWATYRDDLRALYSGGGIGLSNVVVALPAPPTDAEFDAEFD